MSNLYQLYSAAIATTVPSAQVTVLQKGKIRQIAWDVGFLGAAAADTLQTYILSLQPINTSATNGTLIPICNLTICQDYDTAAARSPGHINHAVYGYDVDVGVGDIIYLNVNTTYAPGLAICRAIVQVV